jgi:hypothetical protein
MGGKEMVRITDGDGRIFCGARRKGGKKGGKAAAEKLSKAQRIERAKKAGEASGKARAKKAKAKAKE